MMPRYLVPVLLGVLILLRKLRRNPLFALVGVLFFDRRARRLAAGLLFEFIRNPRIRRLTLRWLLHR
jgi:hypothetical protein